MAVAGAIFHEAEATPEFRTGQIMVLGLLGVKGVCKALSLDRVESVFASHEIGSTIFHDADDMDRKRL